MISFLLSLAVLFSATGDLEMKYTLSAFTQCVDDLECEMCNLIIKMYKIHGPRIMQ